jgi:hypothetical protein
MSANSNRINSRDELLKCAASPAYFINHYVYIYDAQANDWIPFKLWAAQINVLNLLHNFQLTAALKARQIGLTWLGLGYALWQMLFRPIATVLLFSRREDEAKYLLSEDRLHGMYRRLPEWMREPEDGFSATVWKLSNGSTARAFPTSAGDSYTATLVIVDEADIIPDLNRLMRSVKPTIDAGGKMLLISRVDKTTPNSEFKRIYTSAKAGLSGWKAIFLPWWVRPGRDDAWYESVKADIFHRTGSLDDLYEQYPATDAEALASRTLDKRMNPDWVLQGYVEMQSLDAPDAPSIPGLKIYRLPVQNRRYVGGADPAEGNPTSDESAFTLLDAQTGEEVACLHGIFQPTIFAEHLIDICRYYNQASVMVERNNHGHAVIGHLSIFAEWLMVMNSPHDDRPGYGTNSRTKSLLYNDLADALRERSTEMHTFNTYLQILSIEGATLSAPPGDHDDRAMSYGLAWQALLHQDTGTIMMQASWR